MSSKKTTESSVMSLKYHANNLAGSSLLKDLLYERIPLCRYVWLMAVKDRLAGILQSVHSFVFSVISDA
jgi:hypothetical protein